MDYKNMITAARNAGVATEKMIWLYMKAMYEGK